LNFAKDKLRGKIYDTPGVLKKSKRGKESVSFRCIFYFRLSFFPFPFTGFEFLMISWKIYDTRRSLKNRERKKEIITKLLGGLFVI